MKQLIVLLAMLLFYSNVITAQSSNINDYKYVIVPEKYSWTDYIDEYQVNSLTVFLFKKYGMEAFLLGRAIPEDLNRDGCNTLTADVEEKSTLFRTTVKVVLKNCDNEVVFVSQEGKSKEKEIKKAYHAALREAFISLEELQYNYTGGSTVEGESEATPEPTEEKVNPDAAVISEEPKPKPKPTFTVVEGVPEREVYHSEDKSYTLQHIGETLLFYEGENEIGSALKKDGPYYDVQTSEFSGKGYFDQKKFVVEREIKGVAGIIKMNFVKE